MKRQSSRHLTAEMNKANLNLLEDKARVRHGRLGIRTLKRKNMLKHLDGATSQGHAPRVPIVLLYPGTRETGNALSFMGELPADSDYRPRIYPERLS